MSHRRKTDRATRLLAFVALATLALLAAASQVCPPAAVVALAPLGMPRSADGAWISQPSSVVPSARYGHAMASLGGDQVLLFGGSDGASHYGDTWVYSLSANNWTNQAPAAGPSARYRPAMAYLGGDQVLLFGGYTGSYDGQTWVYDSSANTWTYQAAAPGPSIRAGHAMVYLGGDQVLLFGGYDASSLYGDT